MYNCATLQKILSIKNALIYITIIKCKHLYYFLNYDIIFVKEGLNMQKKPFIILVIFAVVAFWISFGLYYGLSVEPRRKKQEQLQLVKEYYQSKVTLFQEQNDTINQGETDVAFIGDSLTEGYNLAEYYPQYNTVNRGIGGDTTHGVQQRLKVSLYDINPKVVVMLIGGNNLKTMLNNYEEILVDIKTNLPQTKVVVVSLSAMGGSFAEKNQVVLSNNAVLRQLANKHGYSFVDIFTPLYNTKTQQIHQEYTTDGAHFSSKGYQVVTSAILPVLQTLLP